MVRGGPLCYAVLGCSYDSGEFVLPVLAYDVSSPHWGKLSAASETRITVALEDVPSDGWLRMEVVSWCDGLTDRVYFGPELIG